MKLHAIRLSNFQSFGEAPTELTLEDITYLIGPNGSGKTAALKALCRLFAFDPSLRRVQRSDFHVPFDEESAPDERKLWIEADFVFPELEKDDNVTISMFTTFRRGVIQQIILPIAPTLCLDEYFALFIGMRSVKQSRG